LSFIKNIVKSNLFKISSLNSVSILIKMALGVLTSKIVAVFVGPNGMALVANLRNFMTSLESISTLGFQAGIVKYITENQRNKTQIQKIISTVFYSLFGICILISFVLFLFADYWNFKIFGTNSGYLVVFKILSLVLPFYAFSLVFLCIINGFCQFKKVIYINIIGTLLGFLVTYFLIFKFTILGALLSIVITPTLLFFVTFFYLSKEINIFETIKIQYFDFQIIKNLSSYSMMALASAVFGPLVFLAIRNQIILNLGLEQAGFWEAISRISGYYMLFCGTLLTVYFLPKLTLANSNQETKSVFYSYFKTTIPIYCLGFLTLYFLRDFIIRTLFTKDFLPTTNLFFWQLIGDVFKVASLILGFQFIAKKRTIAFVISEIMSLSVLYVSSIYFIKKYGIEGVVMAQAFDNFLYLLVLLVFFRKSLF
jgi:O-antigen/teichoic acid export membrane protein